jgi:hypothetical protein
MQLLSHGRPEVPECRNRALLSFATDVIPKWSVEESRHMKNFSEHASQTQKGPDLAERGLARLIEGYLSAFDLNVFHAQGKKEERTC